MAYMNQEKKKRLAPKIKEILKKEKAAAFECKKLRCSLEEHEKLDCDYG